MIGYQTAEVETATQTRNRLIGDLEQSGKDCGLEGEGFGLALLGLTGSKTVDGLEDAQIRAATWEFRKIAQESFMRSPACYTAACCDL